MKEFVIDLLQTMALWCGILAALVAVMMWCSADAHANIIRHGNLKGDIKVIEFSTFKEAVLAPVTVGVYGEHIRMTSRDKQCGITYGGATLGEHGGCWNKDMDGFVVAYKDVTFSFSEPVHSVGAFINYISKDGSQGGVTVSALSRNGVLLESHVVSIETPDKVNDGKFVGIHRGECDIHRFMVSMIDFVIVLDNLTYSTPVMYGVKQIESKRLEGNVPIPEPSTMVLFGTGMVGLVIRKIYLTRKKNEQGGD